MVFISIEFYIFIIALLLIYYIIPLNYRWCVLLVGSICFYYQLSKEN